MDNEGRRVTAQDRNINMSENDGFDPSDYLPRRTSRASALAATQALKKSGKDDKTNSKKMDTVDDGIKKQKQEQKTSNKKGAAQKSKAKKRPHSPYECFVSVVRCEEDPATKSRVKKPDDEPPSEVKPALSDETKTNSTYEIVYGPVSAVGLPASASKQEKSLCKNSDRKDVHANSMKQNKPGPSQSSLSVVVVHPKPGSKIINTQKGRESKSAILQKMISDPNIVISNKVSRVMTSGGKCELKCDMCTKTFAVARDLINHKHTAHKSSRHMCTSCAVEFPTQSALSKHACKAKFRCEICGIFCKQASHLAKHKRMAHSKTLGGYMCYVCCFNASSQHELDSHICGGKPKIVYSAQASSSVLVYPTAQKGKSEPGVPVTQPNIYINLSGPNTTNNVTSPSGFKASCDKDMQYLCETCLNMYPTSDALASHICDIDVDQDKKLKVSDPPNTDNSFLPSAGFAQSSAPLAMDVMPEVEQLAKFYSSVVFNNHQL